MQVAGVPVEIDASIGVVFAPEHPPPRWWGMLPRDADLAMYEAKRMRTGHEVYLPARDRHSRQRLALVGELRRARSRPASSSCTTSRKAELRTGARARRRGARALGAPASAGCSAPATSCRWSSRAG